MSDIDLIKATATSYRRNAILSVTQGAVQESTFLCNEGRSATPVLSMWRTCRFGSCVVPVGQICHRYTNGQIIRLPVEWLSL